MTRERTDDEMVQDTLKAFEHLKSDPFVSEDQNTRSIEERRANQDRNREASEQREAERSGEGSPERTTFDMPASGGDDRVVNLLEQILRQLTDMNADSKNSGAWQ